MAMSISMSSISGVRSSYNTYIPTLWPLFMEGFNCLKALKPLPGDSLLFTTKSPVNPGTHLIDL